MATKKLTAELFLPDIESQEEFKTILSEARASLPNVKIRTKVLSQRLIAESVLVAIVIQVGGKLAYDAIRWFASKLSKKGLSLDLDYVSRFAVAESFLEKNGVRERKLVRRVDYRDLSTYVFVVGPDERHNIVVHADGACDYEREDKN